MENISYAWSSYDGKYYHHTPHLHVDQNILYYLVLVTPIIPLFKLIHLHLICTTYRASFKKWNNWGS